MTTENQGRAENEQDDTVIEAAAREYLSRQSRQSWPDGQSGRGGRWYPSEAEECACCRSIRTPSRRWPFSLLTHCRSAVHVAALYGVSRASLLKAAKLLREDAETRQEECGDV